MTMTEREVVSAALALPTASRITIIKALTESLPENLSAIEAAWFLEAENRVLAFERGELDSTPGEELFRDLRARADG